MNAQSLRRGRPVLFKTLALEIAESKKSRAKKTYVAACHFLGRLSEFFGEKMLKDISELDWARYVVHCQTENPTRQLYDDRKYMSQVIRTAFDLGLAPRPLKLKIPTVRRKINREIPEEIVKRLFVPRRCIGRQPSGAPIYKGIAGPELLLEMEIALVLGLRKESEMFCLEWERFDWQAKSVDIWAPKTGTWRRLPVPDSLFRKLRRRFRKSKSRYVFPSRHDLNKPKRDNKKSWKVALKRVGWKARWHDWRHTTATWMLRAGAPRDVVKAYLSMSERVLAEIYAHMGQKGMQIASRAICKWRAGKKRAA